MNIAKIIDRSEQLVAVIFYALLIQRVWPEKLDAASLAPALIILSEGAIILFLIIRRSATQISLRSRDWVAAFAGTLAPLLVIKSGDPHHLEVGVFLLLFGMVTQLSAKFSLRRSFGLVAANRGVKTGGAYRYVRHPMYLGYMISHVGFLVMEPSWWNFGVYVVAWSCLVLRVHFEERLLSEDDAYQNFKKQVPFRLVPGVY